MFSRKFSAIINNINWLILFIMMTVLYIQVIYIYIYIHTQHSYVAPLGLFVTINNWLWYIQSGCFFSLRHLCMAKTSNTHSLLHILQFQVLSSLYSNYLVVFVFSLILNISTYLAKFQQVSVSVYQISISMSPSLFSSKVIVFFTLNIQWWRLGQIYGFIS